MSKIMSNVSLVNGHIDNEPKDMVEVVRCKDCRHHFPPPHPDGQYAKCKHSCLHTKMTDFCSYGERRGKE